MMAEDTNWFEANADVRSICYYDSHPDRSGVELTIAIPTFQRDELLFSALSSAVTQKPGGMEYSIMIVDNDHSDEHAQEIVQRLKALQTDLRIQYYVNETNVGLFGNWNMCVRNSASPVVALLHDDDVLFDDYSIRAREIINALPSSRDWVYVKTRNCFFTDSEQIPVPPTQVRFGLKKYTSMDALLSLGVGTIGSPTCGSLLNKNAVEELGGFHPDFYPSADVYFAVDAVHRGWKVYLTTRATGGYRLFANVSAKPETMISTLHKDQEIISMLKNRNWFSKVYVGLLGNGKLEIQRRMYCAQLSPQQLEEYPALKEKKGNAIQILGYKAVNFLRRGYRVLIYQRI